MPGESRRPRPPRLGGPARGESLPDMRRSDHAAFWDEGYRAVMLTDTANFRNPHYHQPSDTLDTLDLDFLEGVSEIVVGCIEDLAGLTGDETVKTNQYRHAPRDRRNV